METIMLAGALVTTGIGVFVCVPGHFRRRITQGTTTEQLPVVIASLSKMAAIIWFSQQDFFASVFEKIQQLGEEHGFPISRPDAAAVYLLASTVFSMLLCLAFGPFLAALFTIVAGVGSAIWLSYRQKQQALQSVQQEIPEILRSLSLALRSGKTLFQAMEYVGIHAKGMLAQSFAGAALSMRCGMPIQEALVQLNESISVPGGELLAIALEISQRTGSPLGDILATSSRMVEQRERLVRLLRTKTAQARLSVKIVCSLPFLMLLVLSAFSQDFRQGLFTLQGAVCIAIALTLDGIALLIIKKLMQGISQ